MGNIRGLDVIPDGGTGTYHDSTYSIYVVLQYLLDLKGMINNNIQDNDSKWSLVYTNGAINIERKPKYLLIKV